LKDVGPDYAKYKLDDIFPEDKFNILEVKFVP